MNAHDQQHRALLQDIAHRAMIERGLLPDFSTIVLAELGKIQASPGASNGESVRDLTDLLWASIDNDDSRDLDQLTVAEVMPGDKVKIRVAVADVDALVKDGSAIDEHARHNTTSVYTAAEIFPMLPEVLSTDLTSLNFGEERLAVVVEMVVGADGTVDGSDIYRGTRPQSCEAGLQQRGGLAGGRRRSPRWSRGRRGPGGESARAGSGRPAPEEFAAHPRGAEPGDHRGETDLRRRPNPRSRKSTRRTAPRSSSRIS